MVAGRAIGRGHGRRDEQTECQAERTGMLSDMSFFHRFVAPVLVCSFLAIPAWAERVWDSELKRYLTEEELTHAEVFMTEEEAVKIMLAKWGESGSIRSTRARRCWTPSASTRTSSISAGRPCRYAPLARE